MPKQKASRPRIFVSIASYRDPDCQHTVKDLFEKATHPERIFVGICWQFVKGEDDICFQVPYPRPKQVRVHEVDARQGRGVCWARNIVQGLWKDEEFTLQVDSHMRFEPGWDEALLEMWQACDSDKAILTCYPPGFTPPDNCERERIYGMAAKEFDSHGILLMHGKPPFALNELPEKPIPGAFASACMLFGPSSINKDVPYDPNLYFFGEEITLAVRLWTHGYELYHPNRMIIFHDWDRSKRPTHFTDCKDWGSLNELSFARVRHLLGTERSAHPSVIKDIDKFGLGTARSLKEYQQYSGVDFAKRTISEQALSGIYEPHKTAKARNGAFNIGNGADKKSIFVNIASYRDRECQHTVKDLFEKARHPDRINVGICWQFDEEADKDCFEIITRPGQVRVHPFDWRESEGVCWARHHAQQLWEGEDYSLQTDAHMRFVPGWDELMIEELAACRSDKPVLSSDPASYVPPHNLQQSPRPSIRLALPALPDGALRCRGDVLDKTPEKPLNGAFTAGQFIFSHGNLLQEVPYDPYLYIDQEDMAYAARLYTHGWDVFSPRRQMLYHYYNMDATQSVRPLQWQEARLEDEAGFIALHERAAKRFDHLTGYQLSNAPEVIENIESYNIGSVRTLDQFMNYSGIDLARRYVSDKAIHGGFIRDVEKYVNRSIEMPVSAYPRHSRSPDIHFGTSGIESKRDTPKAPAIHAGPHKPKKVFESKQAIIYDDFLPEDIYERIWRYSLQTDYEYINRQGKTARAWHVNDGSPLRSTLNVYHYAPDEQKPDADYVYPTRKEIDLFMQHLLAIQPEVAHMVGKESEKWGHVTATNWVYPPGTGLALHDDGSGVYTGAYVYFLNPVWRLHWGGLLIMMDEESNKTIHEYRSRHDQKEFYKLMWFNANALDELIMEHGFAKCIMPKKNRIVFIQNEAYHFITRVNESAGDNVRMSIAGFFNYSKAKK